MKTSIKALLWFIGIGAVTFLIVQFQGSSLPAAKLIYTTTTALTWLLGLWLLALAGLVLYLIFSNTTRDKLIPFLTGIHIDAPITDYSVNALKMSMSLILSVLLIISFLAFVRVDVHTGYECEVSGNIAPCTAKHDTKRILFVPAVTLPGSGIASTTLPKTGNMGYFIANTPPVGGSTAAGLAFLTLLFIAISRISLIISRKKADTQQN